MYKSLRLRCELYIFINILCLRKYTVKISSNMIFSFDFHKFWSTIRVIKAVWEQYNKAKI